MTIQKRLRAAKNACSTAYNEVIANGGTMEQARAAGLAAHTENFKATRKQAA